MMKEDGERPSVLKQMTDLHGFVEGLESTYRLLADTAKTELGVVLKSLSGLVTKVSLYLAVEDTWTMFRTGGSFAAQLSASTLVLAVLSVALELAVAAPHPAVKLLLVAAGVVVAVATAYRYDDDEKFLEQYRPGCGMDGAYAEARNVVRRMKRQLNEAEWENQEAHQKAEKLLA
jgi:hypothetical protein